MAIILNFLHFLLISLSIFGYGFIYKSKNISQKNDYILETFLYGVITIIFLSIFINFFLPLNSIITNFFLISSIIISLYFIYVKKLIKILKYIFILAILGTLLTYHSYSYNDYELYHLPYIKILNNFKIIFGLSNLDFRYGHSSIFQNVSAFQYNFFMGEDSYIYFTVICLIILLYKFFKIFLKTNSVIIFIISSSTIIYYLMHANRYGSLGNDMPAHIFSLISYVYFLKIFSENDEQKTNYRIFIITILISFLSKITLIFNSILLLPIFFYKKKLIFDNKIFFLLTFIIFSSFLLKNFINTSCLIYPVKFSCIQTSWLADDYDFSSAKFVKKFSSVNVKEFIEEQNNIYSDEKLLNEIYINGIDSNFEKFNKLDDTQKNNFHKYLVADYYDKINIWIKPYIKNHFKRKIISEIFSITLINLFIFIYCFYFYKNKIQFKKEKYNFFEIYLILLLLASIIIWFFNSPILRYGLSFVLISAQLIQFFLIKKFNNKIFFIKIKKIYTYIFLILFILLVFKNIFRIYSFEPKIFYTNNIVPLKKVEAQEIEHNSFYYFKPVNGTCGKQKPLCTVFSNEFKKSGNLFKIKKGYLFIEK